MDFVGLDAQTRHPVVRLHVNSSQMNMDRIGPVIVCAEHPDPGVFGAHHFLVLPWPRKRILVKSVCHV